METTERMVVAVCPGWHLMARTLLLCYSHTLPGEAFREGKRSQNVPVGAGKARKGDNLPQLLFWKLLSFTGGKGKAPTLSL